MPAQPDALAAQLRQAVADRAAPARYDTDPVLQRRVAPPKAVGFKGPVIQRRPLTDAETKQLAAAKIRLRELENGLDAVRDALGIKNQFADPLGYLHSMDLGYMAAPVETALKFFKEANELALHASNSDKSFRTFMSKLNGYDKSGGKNAIENTLADLDRKLLSQERSTLMQVTKLDEEYFKRYRAMRKPPVRVYRGSGFGVNEHTLDGGYTFTEIPWGGRPDRTFYGVVEHTHTNTQKNGMVSTTTNRDGEGGAKHWALQSHSHGLVWTIELDDYIHVTDLLKRRNFKERFPGQCEILAPESIPARNIVSVTLFAKNGGEPKDGAEIKTVFNR